MSSDIVISSELDPVFYAEFFGLSHLGDDVVKIAEHYLAVGKPNNYVANKEQMEYALTRLLGFDASLYGSVNLAWNFKQVLKNMLTPADKYGLTHFFGSEGNLLCRPVERVYNEVGLNAFNNKWNELYIEIDKHFEFDETFYKSFYCVPESITTRLELFEHWLKHSLFEGHSPNLKWVGTNAFIFELTKVLQRMNIDLNYITNTYLEPMKAHALANNVDTGALSNMELSLFLFLNVGKQLRVFFNEPERKLYVEVNQKKYVDAIEVIKKGKQLEQMGVVAQSYAKDMQKVKRAERAFKDGKLVKTSVALLKKNVKIVTSDNFIAMFKKYNAIPEATPLVDVIGKLIKHVLHNVEKGSAGELNNLDVKNFATSVIFNVFIKDRKDKNEYMAFVKATAKDVLHVVFDELQVPFTIESLVQDIEFLITNKQLIKLYKIATIVSTLLL